MNKLSFGKSRKDQSQKPMKEKQLIIKVETFTKCVCIDDTLNYCKSEIRMAIVYLENDAYLN